MRLLDRRRRAAYNLIVHQALGRTEDQMRLNVSDLLRAPTGTQRRYDVDEPVDGIDPGEVKILSAAVGTIVATRTVAGVLITGELRTTIEAGCSRCLIPYGASAITSLEEEFVPSVDVNTGATLPIPSETDPCLLIGGQHMLDLTEVLRQSLILCATGCGPCRPDCAGLCVTCGQNLNEMHCDCAMPETNSPFGVLKDLLEEDTQKGTQLRATTT